MFSRVVWSILYAFIVAAVWCVFIFVSYIWLGVYEFGGNSERINAGLYVLLALSLIGWLFLSLNGAVGLVYLPLDLILYFVNKPTRLTTEQGYAKKASL
jgi:hypothetical protein